MVCRPVPPDGVYVTEQLADAPAPLRLQLPGVKAPLPPLLLKDTVPVGVIAVPVSVSVTVYWYSVWLSRAPTETSWPACMKNFAPTTCATFGRRRWITA